MIFVTGGTGLVGAHLLYELLTAGEKVKALKRETSDLGHVRKVFSYYTSRADELFEQVEWAEGDILDYFGIEDLLKGIDSVYHCAAMVSFNPGQHKKIIANNVEGTANLVNASLENGVKKFCHVSSVAALGRLKNGFLVDEEIRWAPSKRISGYSGSKFFSEMEVWRGIEEGLDAVIVNPSIILGPGDWDSGSSRFFHEIWRGLKFYTRGETGFVDVKDVVKAMVLLMQADNFRKCRNQRYLLNSENLSYQGLFFQIADALGRPRPKYLASDIMLGIAWRAMALWQFVAGNPPTITRETASGANAINRFNGSKITKCLDFNYTNISSTIRQTAMYLKADME
ncbi:Dihydroflavonol-4-reductase [hydrothermal vent metagenome]|uniref:Dihydroflavonol-4-reductase n=1 Tax=hydrothermal vent metagenome TaxID=652676 RepID=A0A3B0TR12_9ZZZZ